MKLPEGIEIVAIGGESGNIGITAADLHWDGPGQATLFATVTSTFPEEREIEMEVVSAEKGDLARLFTLKIPANGETSESIQLDSIDPVAWLLRARTGDGLAIDDEAPLGLNSPQAIPVQVKAKNPFFFNQVISAFSRADSLFEPIDDFARLSLSEGAPPETEAAVVFAPSGESPFWSGVGEELPPGPPEIVAKDHPLLARLDPSLLTFDGARKLSAPPGSVVVLAHSDGTPLIFTVSTGGRSAVVFNFDPSLEEFFLSPWFPVFVHDAAVMLTGRGARFPSAIATGSEIEVPGTEPTGTASFRSGGAVTPLQFVTPAAIDRVGTYDFTRDSTRWNLGGALFSPGESGAASGEGRAVELIPASGWSAAAWLLLAAIIAILGEELLYHRRKVG